MKIPGEQFPAMKIAECFKAEARAVLTPVGEGGETEPAIETAAWLLSYEEIFDIPIDSIVAATLGIPRADPEEGDHIEIVTEVTGTRPSARVYGATHREAALLRIPQRRDLGLVFVRAKNEEQADLEPEGAAIWARDLSDLDPADVPVLFAVNHLHERGRRADHRARRRRR